MVRTLLALAWLLPLLLFGGTATDIARAVRENSFDRDECYRVRDLIILKEDIRVYLTDGYLIFSKPVAGRRMAAVFSADVEGGDGEVILLPPDRAERRSLAAFIDAPNLDEHIRAALLLFTGDVYDRLKSQMANNPANRKAPEMARVLDEEWSPVLRNLGASYQVRLVLDLLAGPAHADHLFAGMFRGSAASRKRPPQSGGRAAIFHLKIRTKPEPGTTTLRIERAEATTVDSSKWTLTNTEAIVMIRRRLWTGWSLALTGYYPLGRIVKPSNDPNQMVVTPTR